MIDSATGVSSIFIIIDYWKKEEKKAKVGTTMSRHSK